ncbi:hypothetical protein EPA93_39780 [Ktedonosporobacter rubrisoli]|uniref:M23ase beta-sheet core domain-containing protein n=1 Tax=Ktedonosporobacter rubrisoli TaxID=2509675 RepID=A0A4P6K141_KTERU|nr:peptidoglycan DD-metalloendopeptidase family protein [Ktedonosporobacter rubrisoli]QBD81789.1 hypothetical protein EPA93_39780 [Ktedonosporobacter rubrisoli]
MSSSPDRRATNALLHEDQPTLPMPALPSRPSIQAPQTPEKATDQFTVEYLNGKVPGSTPQSTTNLLPAPTFFITGQLPPQISAITGQLPPEAPRITRPLTTRGLNTTTTLPTLIPATEKRPRTTPPKGPRRRHPIVHIIVAICSIVMLILTAIFVTPLATGQQQDFPSITNIFSTGASGTFNPSQHLAPPTPTPALLTNEGYCGGTDIWGTCATAVTASGVMGTGQFVHPVAGATITQPFAHPEFQTWCSCIKPHSGIDLAAPYGSPILAADSGQVIWTGWDWSGLGWAVKINHGHYIATIYGHLARFIVKVGQNVTKGQVIAYEGSTGASTGPHVHFMVLVNNIWVDPTTYVALP